MSAQVEPNCSRKILIFRTGQLGDTVVSLPAIRAIRAGYPNHRLILLTPHQSSKLVSPLEVLSATKYFSQVLFYATPSSAYMAWIQLSILAAKIRRLKPEIFFYFRDLPWHQAGRDRFFFETVCGMKRSYGFDNMSPSLGQDSSGRLFHQVSEVERLLAIVAKANIAIPDSDEVAISLPISQKEHSKVDALWQKCSIQKKDLAVGFGPGSKMPAKRWPPERFVAVGKYLLASFPDSQLIIFGGHEDFLLGEEIKRALGERVVNLAGSLTILESAEGLRRCTLYVGNDTGTMHLAAAVGTPCIAIFSARDHPGRWEPRGRNHAVLRKEPACAGCLLEVCVDQDMRCLKEIRVDEVLNAIQGVLGQRVADIDRYKSS